MLARRSQRCFHPIGAGLSLAALVRLETIGAGPLLVVSFRVGWCRTVVGNVGSVQNYRCWPVVGGVVSNRSVSARSWRCGSNKLFSY